MESASLFPLYPHNAPLVFSPAQLLPVGPPPTPEPQGDPFSGVLTWEAGITTSMGRVFLAQPFAPALPCPVATHLSASLYHYAPPPLPFAIEGVATWKGLPGSWLCS